MTLAHQSQLLGLAYTGAQLKLMRGTVAKDCTPLEFDLFVTVAQKAGLDPLRRQISAIVFDKSDQERRRMSIITNIDGLRAIAARTGRYRPDEAEPQFETDAALRSPENPLGLIKASVRIYVSDSGQERSWNPVMGVAFWDEYAPLVEEPVRGYDWIETGERWADSGRPKKRKVPRSGEVIRRLDPSGQWMRMPRVMLAKCAEAQALRRAFPERLSALYETAEMDQANVSELSPTQALGEFDTAQRLERAQASNGVIFQLAPGTPLQSIPLGQLADRILETVGVFTTAQQIDWFQAANALPLREFWARAPGDALEVKRAIEHRTAQLQTNTREEGAPCAPGHASAE